MNPDHDREPNSPEGRGPDIEVQAVLAFDDWLREKDVERRKIRRILHRRGVREGVTHATPTIPPGGRVEKDCSRKRGRPGEPLVRKPLLQQPPPQPPAPDA